jgi:hypothetical protein
VSDLYLAWFSVYCSVKASPLAFTRCIEFVRDNPETINWQSKKSGWTLLHQAAYWQVDRGVLQQLFDLKADRFIADKHGIRPADVAPRSAAVTAEPYGDVIRAVFGATPKAPPQEFFARARSRTSSTPTSQPKCKAAKCKVAHAQHHCKRCGNDDSDHRSRACPVINTLLVMRHSERLDEISEARALPVGETGFDQWADAQPSLGDTRHRDYILEDTPLTQNGKAIARRAAQTSVGTFPRPSRLYVSKLRRCVETAYELAQAWGGLDLFVASGLSLTAAAVERYGLEGPAAFQFLSIAQLQALCPGVKVVDADDPTCPECVVKTSAWDALCDVSLREPFNCVVAHRETVKYLAQEQLVFAIPVAVLISCWMVSSSFSSICLCVRV